MDWEFGISRCKLLYIEWINNKVLLYSTGYYIQYPVINHNGKELKKRISLAVMWRTDCGWEEWNQADQLGGNTSSQLESTYSSPARKKVYKVVQGRSGM